MPYELAFDYSTLWRFKDDNVDYYTPAFYTQSYDSSGWGEGSGGVYGQGTLDSLPGGVSILTTIQNPTTDTRTYYFTKDITVKRANALIKVVYNVICDDGFVIWVNGTETQRFNVTGSLSHGKDADSAIGGAAEGTPVAYTKTAQADLNLFVEGTNRIAVMLFDRLATSSDVGFGMKLEFTFRAHRSLLGVGN